MKLGIVYPQIELNGDPEALRRIGLAAEQLGFDHFLMYDHVVGAARVVRDPPLWDAQPYADNDPFHDPLVAFGYLAAITKRIEFVTGILILPQRQTVLVAKQATDVQLLSGGRLRLGVGTGWSHVEYDALGENFELRGPRFSEQIPYLRRLWSEPLISFEGRFHTIDRANIVPRPTRPIPIYCGGLSEPAYRRAAALADGFIFAASFENSAKPGMARVTQLLAEAGRPLDSFGHHWLVMHDDPTLAIDVQTAADKLRQWRDLGGTHASIVSMNHGFTTAEQHIDYYAEVRRRAAL